MGLVEGRNRRYAAKGWEVRRGICSVFGYRGAAYQIDLRGCKKGVGMQTVMHTTRTAGCQREKKTERKDELLERRRGRLENRWTKARNCPSMKIWGLVRGSSAHRLPGPPLASFVYKLLENSQTTCLRQ